RPLPELSGKGGIHEPWGGLQANSGSVGDQQRLPRRPPAALGGLELELSAVRPESEYRRRCRAGRPFRESDQYGLSRRRTPFGLVGAGRSAVGATLVAAHLRASVSRRTSP